MAGVACRLWLEAIGLRRFPPPSLQEDVQCACRHAVGAPVRFGGKHRLIGGGAYQAEIVRSGKMLLERRWHLVAATVDSASGMVTLVERPLQHHPSVDDGATISQTIEVSSCLPASGVVMAGRLIEGGAVEHHYNGKIDSPAIFGRTLSIE